MKSMSKVGIYSGVFDPIHKGHLAFANAAIDKGFVDEVVFLVEPTPRRKQHVSALRDRMNMVWLATHTNPRLGLYDLQQQTFTVRDSLPELEKEFGNIVMLIGSDLALDVPHWPDFDVLQRNVQFVIGLRSNDQMAELPFEHVTITTEARDISSSIIRTTKTDLERYVPKEVGQYIVSHKLYDSVA